MVIQGSEESTMELACRYWPAQEREIAKIVLLHGMGGTGSLWRPHAAALEREYSLLAPDQRGHGGSRLPEHEAGHARYLPEDYGLDVRETLQSRDVYPAFVVGHSMGVRTAVATAHLRHPLVRGLVLVDLGFY